MNYLNFCVLGLNGSQCLFLYFIFDFYKLISTLQYFKAMKHVTMQQKINVLKPRVFFAPIHLEMQTLTRLVHGKTITLRKLPVDSSLPIKFTVCHFNSRIHKLNIRFESCYIFHVPIITIQFGSIGLSWALLGSPGLSIKQPNFMMLIVVIGKLEIN